MGEFQTYILQKKKKIHLCATSSTLLKKIILIECITEQSKIHLKFKIEKTLNYVKCTTYYSYYIVK